MVPSQATILVADDDTHHMRRVELLLRPRGYALVTASNGAEALHQVSREPPDLLLLDMRTPLVDGFEVCKLLKEHPETRLLPVVLMTARDHVDDRIKGLEAGADYFLTKPVHGAELLARIRTSLRVKWALDATRDRLRQETSPRPSAVADPLFRQEGDYWTLAYHGTVCRLKDVKGLHYLAWLLGHPGQATHAGALVRAVDPPPALPAALTAPALRDDRWAALPIRVDGLGDAGAALDAQAKAAYKRRLTEVQEELAEAQRFHDLARAANAQAELEFLTAELVAAVGLGGRDRHGASSAERARLMVTKAIKAALHKMRAHHPALSHHLATSITTGTFCTYTPDPTCSPSWSL